MKKIFFGVPDIGKKEIDSVVRVMKSKWIGFGKVSLEFEEKLRQYLGAKDAALLSSCTAALHLALVSHNVKPGDEIIAPTLTFAATANVICYCGAKPVFVDVNPGTLNIDETKIEAAITKKTKGIIVVHFAGLPCDMEKINAIARRHNLFVIEDAAHAIGASYKGKRIGNSNNFCCFSFYPNKNLSTMDGGLLTNGKKSLIEQVKVMRTFGLDKDAWKRYKSSSILTMEVMRLGYKYNLSDVHSAIGLVQLQKLEKNLRAREKYAKLYDRVLGDIEGVSFQNKFNYKNIRHALHLYLIILDPEKFKISRDEIVMKLRDAGIFAVVHYKPLHLHKFHSENFGYKEGDFPIAEKIGENIITLPLLPSVGPAIANRVAETTKKVLLKYKR